MFLVAALDIPTREEIDDVIREAERILSDAVLDDETHITTTRVAPPRTAPRARRSGDPDATVAAHGGSAPMMAHVPWARSPPGRQELD